MSLIQFLSLAVIILMVRVMPKEAALVLGLICLVLNVFFMLLKFIAKG